MHLACKENIRLRALLADWDGQCRTQANTIRPLIGSGWVELASNYSVRIACSAVIRLQESLAWT